MRGSKRGGVLRSFLFQPPLLRWNRSVSFAQASHRNAARLLARSDFFSHPSRCFCLMSPARRLLLLGRVSISSAFWIFFRTWACARLPFCRSSARSLSFPQRVDADGGRVRCGLPRRPARREVKPNWPRKRSAGGDRKSRARTGQERGASGAQVVLPPRRYGAGLDWRRLGDQAQRTQLLSSPCRIFCPHRESRNLGLYVYDLRVYEPRRTIFGALHSRTAWFIPSVLPMFSSFAERLASF